MEEPVALIFEDQHKLVVGFTEFFIKLLGKGRDRFSVALSGGSTPKIWFDYLASHMKDQINWNRIHFFWGDERCVPPDDHDSNYGMTKFHLLDHIDIPEENIHRIQGEIEPVDAALNYSKELNENLRHDDVPVFDLVILGMGDDGHTASIFPHQIELWDVADPCVVATHPISGQQRVSINGSIINSARAVAFLVTGNSKAERVKEIIEEEPHAAYYPASLVKPATGTLHWFLDNESAKLLNNDQ